MEVNSGCSEARILEEIPTIKKSREDGSIILEEPISGFRSQIRLNLSLY